ncbi:glycosyltransferase family 2 protein [Priestia megaterium]|uniref:Glycosyltransferase like 2 family protein n=1 Tax=Priestia megaterium (strain ATCC 14581 / DSM 32 / CCUG 1817 / JCM 2506 / NBRC 15308 / NCIMB 9376 / NCTC 10342 / NRRL B-14308 / VKM B-512 / Ford 19) TaxID=1348623 RepID=A0A0B6AQS9_PRIM2|nr:glycosyltransferase family 2 protein [Priestia megaterium]AJI22204.1 glycosyltransferase like 2 family protein [Priestia megaterium NBRC 15308 = ATCC 14581]KFM96147.1 glycosyl transferase 2 family protein [Priestia megaterium]KGJ73720.1 glycosyltransferase [Priestia megaterium NBRC 15308 = ATCC 14581]MDR4231184.1 glycosyltransferase family 2 protein [Priestia megaterium]MED3807446.1 glycosyltransferase family 2 protein [Priestia megaterium]
MSSIVKYSIVVPVYNEEEVIHETYRRLTEVMHSTKEAYELLFVNDGSRDRTAEMIKEYSEQDPAVVLLDFARNFGHQIAITAGMDYARGEAVVVIDADLQDPPELILEMIEKWKQGFDVVYAKRTKRKGETYFKKQTAAMFYRFLRAMTDIDIPLDTGDFRLLDRKVCNQMNSIQEKNRFVRGLVSWVGFKQIAVEYERDERLAGESKYPLKKMLKLSMDGITSFSYKPLKLASYAGVTLSGIGFIYLLVVLYLKLFTDSTITGWSSLIVIQLFFSGIILIILGMIGEYIGRIYDETKNRPLYIVREKYQLEPRKEVSLRD